MTNRAIISEIVNDLRALSVDDQVSERYILSKLRYYNAMFLMRENDKLRLYYDSNIWTTLDCLEMAPADNTECADVRIPKTGLFMKSVEQLPEIYSYKNGPIVREVMPLDGSKIYMPTTPMDYVRILNREYRDPRQKYYWFQDGHIVVPESSMEKITITACFVDPYEAKRLSTCSKDLGCDSPLDHTFPCPAHLIAVVKDATIKDLFNFYKRNIKDEVADSNNNIKTNNA